MARPSMSPKNRSQKAEGIPSRKMIPPRIQLACFRLQPCSSIEKRRRSQKGKKEEGVKSLRREGVKSFVDSQSSDIVDSPAK